MLKKLAGYILREFLHYDDKQDQSYAETIPMTYEGTNQEYDIIAFANQKSGKFLVTTAKTNFGVTLKETENKYDIIKTGSFIEPVGQESDIEKQVESYMRFVFSQGYNPKVVRLRITITEIE